MANELYFIRILQEALQNPQPRVALDQALAEIGRLGAQEAYRSGWENFQRFMAEVSSCRDLLRSDAVRELIVALATDSPELDPQQRQAALEVIHSNPQWHREYEQMRAQLVPESGREPAAIQVYRDGNRVGEMTFVEPGASRSLGQITPGLYLLKLSTGLVLWEGELAGPDLFWAEAFGAENLKLAAETEQVQRQPTGEIELLRGEVILRIFAGLECGDLEVEWIG
jgi:hypothetical protein